ncbi:MAG: hypothetical protein J5627_00950 [Bacilli bacterium]|nr:hypothetical protein [Bacilli bacterium]
MKKLTSAALLSLALLLASCGGDGNSTPTESSLENTDSVSTSLESDSAATSQADTSEETSADKVKALFTTLAETNNGTYTSKGYFTEQHFGDGMLHLLDSSKRTTYWGYGEAKIANYGIAQFLYTNDTMGVDTEMSSIVSPNTNLAYKDYNHVLADLGESGKNITFAEASRSHTFSTSDAEFIQSLVDLDGLGLDGVADEFTEIKAYFNLSDDGKGFESIGYSLKGSKSQKYNDISFSGCSLTNIGTTAKNAKVDAYVKSNPTFSPATAWDADTMAYIAQAAGSVSFTLPFPAQTSYAYSMPTNSDTGMIYADLGCGNKNNAYGQALVTAGFELDATNSSAADNFYVYTKTISETQGLKGGKTALVGLSYSTATDEAATIYPNGIWSVYFLVQTETSFENVTLAEVNTELQSHKLISNPATPIVPTFTLLDGYTKIDYLDTGADTAEYLEYMASYYGLTITINACFGAEIHVYYPEASADAAVANVISQVTAAGFTQETNTSGQPIEGSYSSNADATADASLEVSVAKALDSTTGAYKGFIYIAVTHLKYSVSR